MHHAAVKPHRDGGQRDGVEKIVNLLCRALHRRRAAITIGCIGDGAHQTIEFSGRQAPGGGVMQHPARIAVGPLYPVTQMQAALRAHTRMQRFEQLGAVLRLDYVQPALPQGIVHALAAKVMPVATDKFAGT